jgi:hypothetical protein
MPPIASRSELMRRFLLGSAAALVCLSQIPTPGDAARPPRGASAQAQQAIIECRQRYSGNRGRAVNQARSTFIEGCFKQATGHYPFELGIPIYPPGYDWRTNPDAF